GSPARLLSVFAPLPGAQVGAKCLVDRRHGQPPTVGLRVPLPTAAAHPRLRAKLLVGSRVPSSPRQSRMRLRSDTHAAARCSSHRRCFEEATVRTLLIIILI